MPVPGIDELVSRLVAYGQFVQAMIEKSRRALVSREPGLPREIIDRDEPQANKTEIELEAECVSLIARHQPMARELRTILMVSSITNDLERMADHAVNIAEAVADHIHDPSLKPEDSILEMFDKTIRMVDGAIRAFSNQDAALGQSVCQSDNAVDELPRMPWEGGMEKHANRPQQPDRRLDDRRLHRLAPGSAVSRAQPWAGSPERMSAARSKISWRRMPAAS